MKLHNSTTNICLYSSVSPCPFPIKSPTSVMKSAKVSGHLLVCELTDWCVSQRSIDLKSENWKVSDAVREAEGTLEFKKIIGYHLSNRAGLDQSQPLQYLQNGLMRIENCFINCPGNWQREVAGKSCSAEPWGPMDKMVQLFEIRSLLENNSS